MPKRSSKKRPADTNRLAHSIVQESLGEAPDPDEGKDPAAVALGRKGGLKGGKARAKNMTKEQRSDAAKKLLMHAGKTTKTFKKLMCKCNDVYIYYTLCETGHNGHEIAYYAGAYFVLFINIVRLM